VELFTFDDFVLINRAKINRIVNTLLWLLILTAPAVAVCIKSDIFVHITYNACIVIAAVFILLAAIDTVLVKIIPQSVVTVFFGIGSLLLETYVFSYLKADVFLTFTLIPFISIFYCQRFIYHFSAVLTFVNIETSFLFRNNLLATQDNLNDFLGATGGFLVEFGVIYFTGIFLGRAIRGYFKRSYDNQMEVISGKEITERQFETLQSLVDIYLSAHLIDLENDSFVELKSTREINSRVYELKNLSCESIINTAMTSLTSDHHLNQVLYFVDLKTLPDRLKGKKIISMEFNGKINGWCRASFINVESDKNGVPLKVLYTVQVIDEEKKTKQYLLNLSRVDKLTELGNRAAYEACVKQHEINGVTPVFTIIQLDVNGLKKINDTQGHAAGDELIKGAADCIRKVFGESGNCFRTGGDEFVVIIEADLKRLNKLCSRFDKTVSDWKGKLVESLHISYGYVRGEEMPYTEIIDMANVADERMYKMKKAFYESQGK